MRASEPIENGIVTVATDCVLAFALLDTRSAEKVERQSINLTHNDLWVRQISPQFAYHGGFSLGVDTIISFGDQVHLLDFIDQGIFFFFPHSLLWSKKLSPTPV